MKKGKSVRQRRIAEDNHRRKVHWPTKKAAIGAAERTNWHAYKAGTLQVYRCQICFGWLTGNGIAGVLV